jgi:hypothetical protein
VRWWKELLWQGAIYRGDAKWPEGEIIPIGDLHDSCLAHAKRLGERRMMPMNVFSKELRKLLPSVKSIRPLDKDTGERKRAYLIPSLTECREHYDEIMGGKSEWPEGSACLYTLVNHEY